MTAGPQYMPWRIWIRRHILWVFCITRQPQNPFVIIHHVDTAGMTCLFLFCVMFLKIFSYVRAYLVGNRIKFIYEAGNDAQNTRSQSHDDDEPVQHGRHVGQVPGIIPGDGVHLIPNRNQDGTHQCGREGGLCLFQEFI